MSGLDYHSGCGEPADDGPNKFWTSNSRSDNEGIDGAAAKNEHVVMMRVAANGIRDSGALSLGHKRALGTKHGTVAVKHGHYWALSNRCNRRD